MESFFIILLSYQTPLNIPRASHTAAVFVRTSPAGDVTEEFTISWLPTRLKGDAREDISLFQDPEPGSNFTRTETMRLGMSRRRSVTRWGPFQVRPEFYASARRRFDFLNAGGTRYTVLDHDVRGAAFQSRPGGAVNCIHALSDVFGARPLPTGTLRGNPATEAVLVHFLEGNRDLNFVRYPVVHEWLAERMGVAPFRHAARLPMRGSVDGVLRFYELAELDRGGAVRRTLETGSAFYAPEVGVRLLPPEAIAPQWVPAAPGPVSR